MEMKEIFGKALCIESPRYVVDVMFDVSQKRLDIQLDFNRITKTILRYNLFS